MKRIVFIIPDKKFGSAYKTLKTTYYPSYDMYYEQLSITYFKESQLTIIAANKYQQLLKLVEEIKKANPSLYDTLLLDYLNELLKECSLYFVQLKESDLKTSDGEKLKNLKMLLSFQSKL